MSLFPKRRSLLLVCGSALLLTACTQGEEIASPGAVNPGTPPGGGGGPSGPGGGGTAQCPTGFTDTGTFGDFVACRLAGVITSDLTLPFIDGVAYQLDGRVDIGQDAGLNGGGGPKATLTIEPGVTVFGSGGADYLVVNRGSRIVADGEENDPIIFTSQADLERQADGDPNNDRGETQNSEWGGLVLLGRAPINECNTGTVAGMDCENIVEGVTNPDAIFGGNDANDDSGVLRYVQVKFAGFDIDGNGNELNGVSFAGVGSGTIVDYLQVHNNLDDGVEFFGGTVDVKHVVLTGNFDDSMDTDLGWVGRAQFVLIEQRDEATEQGDNAFEMSGDTNPRIANFTVVGGGNNAFRINSGHIGLFENGVVAYDNPCLNWEDTAGDGNPGSYGGVGNDPSFNSVLFDCTALTDDSPDTQAAVEAVDMGSNNTTATPNTLMGMFLPGMNELPPNAIPVDFTGDPFFDVADYLGAFGPNETETNNWTTGWTFDVFPDPECPSHANISTTGQKNGVNVCSLSGVVTTDLTLTRGNLYEIEGRVDAGIDDGLSGGAGAPVDFEIEPGVTLFGNGGADYIVVNRGSRILAAGTEQNPIIFTSEADVDNTGSAMERLVANSEWGGLVLLGQAPINECNTGSVAGMDCENIVEGVTNPDAIFGGNDANDDSGILRYVQVKFAGFDIDGNGNELNGVSFAGVGDATMVDFVQVHNNLDDGVEFFGGTVNVSHLVLTGNFDDSMDTDLGWVGAAQYVIILQRDDASEQGDNAFEMSGDTDPRIANFTVVGGGNNAFRINSGHIGRFFNGVVSYDNPCFNWEDTAGDGNPNAYGGVGNDPSFDSVLFDCSALTNDSPDTPAADEAVDMGSNNTTNVMSSLVNTFVNGQNEDMATEFQMALSGVDPFFEDTDYIGAVKDLNDAWWRGWTCSLETDPC